MDPTPANNAHGRFPVKFYLVGMTFIIFDIEVVFLYPGQLFRKARPVRAVAALIFIALSPFLRP